jgi:cleavage and polyadenylation specificity factor subunit 1
MTTFALHQPILSPSGIEHAVALRLTPATKSDLDSPTASSSTSTRRALCNIVTARSNHLRIYEVLEEPSKIDVEKENERERVQGIRKGTEAVEGEVEMDEQGEGFVNMGSVKVFLSLVMSLSPLHNIFLLPHPA